MVYYKSINIKNASLEEREIQFKNRSFLNKQGEVFLQTCNRIEIYGGKDEVPEDVVRHLFRVVSGLESALPGERAIQGQVKKAFLEAHEKYKLSFTLHRLFQAALTVGKKVRTETGISHGAVSHSLAAIELLKDENIEFKNAFITVIGVNKLTEDTIKFLKNKGSETIFLANRSFEKAKSLADKTGCAVYDLKDKKTFLEKSDVVISATSAPHTIINKEDIRPDKKLLIIDMAFPRDVDKELNEYPNVKLYNLETIESHIRKNLLLREQATVKANTIIEEEIYKFREQINERLSNNSKYKICHILH